MRILIIHKILHTFLITVQFLVHPEHKLTHSQILLPGVYERKQYRNIFQNYYKNIFSYFCPIDCKSFSLDEYFIMMNFEEEEVVQHRNQTR